MQSHLLVICMKIKFTTFSAMKWFIVSFLTDSKESITSPVAIVGIIRVNPIGAATNFTLGCIKQKFIMLGTIKLRLFFKHLWIEHDLLGYIWVIATDWWKIIHSSERRVFWLSKNRVIWASLFTSIYWTVFIAIYINCSLSTLHPRSFTNGIIFYESYFSLSHFLGSRGWASIFATNRWCSSCRILNRSTSFLAGVFFVCTLFPCFFLEGLILQKGFMGF